MDGYVLLQYIGYIWYVYIEICIVCGAAYIMELCVRIYFIFSSPHCVSCSTAYPRGPSITQINNYIYYSARNIHVILALFPDLLWYVLDACARLVGVQGCVCFQWQVKIITSLHDEFTGSRSDRIIENLLFHLAIKY